ncbi:MAG: oxidoreductase [Acidothermales bacterium]|nr:oxidoreductase [Acidothermales bacterium]
MERVVVVGGGLAGLRVVTELRDRGYAGRLTLLGAERHPPYDRPPLSKAVLSGAADKSTLDADWTALDVQLLLGKTATALRDVTDAGGVVDTDAGSLDFSGCVISTGATPVRLPGGGRQRVLRTIDDALALRAALRSGARVVVVGAGWIGAEVATAAAAVGCRVTVVEATDAPLGGVLPAEVGAPTARWYADSGVDLRTNTRVTAVHDAGVELDDGMLLPADEVVTAVGVRPETGWLAGSLLPVDRAILVSPELRTALPPVYAVGDCAAWESARYASRVHVEHWDTALRAPAVAAANLLGGRERYDPVPYFWSEQFGRTVQYAGYHRVADRLVWRGDSKDSSWTVCWLRRDSLVAVLTVDRPRDLAQARRAMERGAQVDADRLADPNLALRDTLAR